MLIPWAWVQRFLMFLSPLLKTTVTFTSKMPLKHLFCSTSTDNIQGQDKSPVVLAWTVAVASQLVTIFMLPHPGPS